MENKIELKVGDVFRLNKARKKNIVVNIFEYNGKKMYTYHDVEHHLENLGYFEIMSEHSLCGVTVYYGNVWGGIVEVNGKIVRGTGGKLITPKDVKPKKETKPLTDFQKYVQLQNSGRINMTDTTSVATITGLSLEKVEDIMWHYSEYKSGKRS